VKGRATRARLGDAALRQLQPVVGLALVHGLVHVALALRVPDDTACQIVLATSNDAINSRNEGSK